MDIPDKDIEELVKIWKEEFGVTMSADDVRSRASVVLDLFLKIAEALPSEITERDLEKRNHAA
jgi:hypothetical protein